MPSKKNRTKIMIMPYRGYASEHRLLVRGRVLEDEVITIKEDENLITTLRNAYKRFESDEIPLAGVEATFRGERFQVTANKEGYFYFDEKISIEHTSDEAWEDISFRVTTIPAHNLSISEKIKARGEILIPSSKASFGIISDIDDTVLKTDVSHRLKLLRNTLLKSSFKRIPLPGISHWLEALRKGDSGQESNPIFYISKSPRNLYDYLEHFLAFNECPKGPILLRDLGWITKEVYRDYPGHKKEEIMSILDTYPNLPFIFLGDIAGKDPEIYDAIRQKYSDRVLAIYIRDINHRRKQKIYQRWISKHQIRDIQLINDTLSGAHHSLTAGFISADSFKNIQKSLKT